MSCLPWASWAAKKAAQLAGGSGDNIPTVDVESVVGASIPLSLVNELYERASEGKTPFVLRVFADGKVIYTGTPVTSHLMNPKVLVFETLMFGESYKATFEVLEDSATLNVAPYA